MNLKHKSRFGPKFISPSKKRVSLKYLYRFQWLPLIGLLSGLLGWLLPLKHEARAASWEFLSLPAPPGRVLSPKGIAIDRSDQLYVADAGNDRIQVRTVSGEWRILAASGSAPGEVLSPTDVAVDGLGNLFVLDAGNYRLQMRDPSGEWSVIATEGTGIGQVRGANGLGADAQGHLFVAEGESGNNRVQQRNPDGQWSLVPLPKSDASPFGFSDPRDVVIDTQGALFVGGKWGLLRRGAKGDWTIALKMFDGIGSNCTNYFSEADVLAADQAGAIYIQSWDMTVRRDETGTTRCIEPSSIPDIRGLAVDSAGRIYRSGYRSQITSVNGITRTETGIASPQMKSEEGMGAMLWPEGLWATPEGEVFIAEGLASWSVSIPDWGGRLQKRDLTGRWTILRESDGTPARVRYPSDVWVDPENRVYVLDSGNNRIRLLSPDGTWGLLSDTKFPRPYLTDHDPNLLFDGAGGVWAVNRFPARWRSPEGIWTELTSHRWGNPDSERIVKVVRDRHQSLLLILRDSQFRRRGVILDREGNV